MKKISVLIDATYISGGGGCILLIDLVEKLLKDGFNVGIILDYRLKDEKFLIANSVCCIHSNILTREFSIYKNGKNFDITICFNNVGTILRYSFPLIVYFHNVLYLKNTSSFKFHLKKLFFILSAANRNIHWVCQTRSVQVELKNYLSKYFIKISPLIYPFFPLESDNLWSVVEHSHVNGLIRFIYVSDGHIYKNHYILIDAFCMLIDRGYDAELSLTISEKFPELQKHICYIKSLGYKINNHLNVPHGNMSDLLRCHDVAVYPSSNESFGLGLIEAAQCELPIIASNLSYVSDVVKPFRFFESTSIESIFGAMASCYDTTLIPSLLVTKDRSLDFFKFLRGVSRYVFDK